MSTLEIQRLARVVSEKTAADPAAIAIAATFTAEPVAQPLDFWMRELQFPYSPVFAPYDQVFQTLLDYSGVFALNRGLNVVLFRWQDWASDAQSNLERFSLSLKSASAIFPAPLLAISCACSDFDGADEFDAELTRVLLNAPGLTFLPIDYQRRLYPVAAPFDPRAEKLGRIPYSPEYFAALGTMIARYADSLRRPPFKVIALDCDNTLWRGVVGEDGVEGISLDPGSRAVQEFVAARQQAGMLLTICSKNNEPDVLEVFERRADMPLRISQVVSHRIDWNPKSQNLPALARELDLGLDSFVFLDDDGKECAEMQANCPSVLTLRLPDRREEFGAFLEHVWAFDQWRSTKDDANRTAVYIEKLQRERLQRDSGSLADFIAGLELRIRIEAMRPDQLARVSQLTQRTNQFNCTTIRRGEPEIAALLGSGMECLTVTVADRFGDYGLVGALLLRANPEALLVDTFVLSCRALGRGVEHRILAHLGEMCQERNLPRIDIPFRRTAKNSPAQTFLEGLTGATRRITGQTITFELPAHYAATLEYRPGEAPAAGAELREDSDKPIVSSTPATRTDYARIATDLRRPSDVLARMSEESVAGPLDSNPTQAPRTPVEAKLVNLWSAALRQPVNIHDNYFNLGGDSLTAVVLLSRIAQEFSIENLTMSSLLDAPTVAEFACLLVRGGSKGYQTVVQMRPGADCAPVYIIHGGGGNILSLRELAKAMPEHRPVYCLQARGLDGSPPFTSVEETAAHYVAEIRKIQPSGPYFFGGHCYGGLVAFEMARAFRDQGQQVGLVALIDTYNFAYGPSLGKPRMLYANARFLAKRAASNLVRLCRMQRGQRSAYITGRLRLVHRYLGGLAGVIAGRKNSQIMSGPLVGVPQAGQTEFEQILERVAAANVRNQESYVPKPYAGAITVLRAEHPISEPYEEPALGWTPLARGGLDLRVTPGDHDAMTTEPLVHDLARILEDCIGQAEAKYGSFARATAR